MSTGFNFFLHIIFVTLCVGLGYMLRWSMEEFKAMDQQAERLTQPDQPSSGPNPPVQSAASALQAKADPAKLAELKASIKK
jgi:hypothetical protein